ncbi:hypothetical protein ANN_14893 [Periplaneta americana]|uniref:Uncharacterized protein n=1 Tax=Periplaneta americana TaxID=6978 RepID=A0ABQ8SXJ7_PERAM|nr:hypothetical protein ANN_14893 [Periplaneta americana]
MYSIKNLQQLETETAIAPIATYGLNIIWEKLNNQLHENSARSKKNNTLEIIYELRKESFFIEDIRTQLCMHTRKPFKYLEEKRTPSGAISM